MAAEGDREFESVFEWLHTADERHAIEIALRIWIIQVDGRWHNAGLNTHRQDRCLQAARCAKQVASHRFR